MTSVRGGLRSVERPFKKAVVSVLRLLLGSRPVRLTPASCFKRILVIRQHNQLGDMLCVVPLLRTLRTSFPQAAITLLASPVNAPIMEHNRFLDSVLLYDKTDFLRRHGIRLHDFWRYVRALRQRGFDLVVVPATVSTSFTSDLLAFLSGAGVRIGNRSLDGVENPSWFLYNIARDLDWRSDPGRHQTLRNSDILGDWLPAPTDLTSEVTLTDKEREKGAEWIAQQRPGTGKTRVAFHPGAGKAPNRWPADRFALVAKAIAGEFDADLFVTKGPMDSGPVEEMVNAFGKSIQVIENQPIRRVASIISNMDLVVSNDTGIMHVAAALRVPVISLFGPTEPRQWAPIGPLHRYIQGEGGDVQAIQTETVLAACRELLGEITSGRSGGV